MSEPKPCLFCEDKNATVEEPFHEGEYAVVCTMGCGACGPPDEDAEKAVEFWNTRPEEDRLQAEIERLKKILDHKKLRASTAAKMMEDARTAALENELSRPKIKHLQDEVEQLKKQLVRETARVVELLKIEHGLRVENRRLRGK
jgi:predicted RNase H-like nuclease (RuvC/YqgF family)